jgi:integrase
MAQRDVKGLHRVVVKGNEYWYAWRGRGAPRVHGEYGTPDFWASYDAAVRERHVPDQSRVRSLVVLYKASGDYEKLAASTKRHWSRWLDHIAEHFGELSIAAFDNPKVRKIIRQWRNRYAATPRAADMGMQVLSRVCSYAVDPLGKLASNPCEGIKALYVADRSDVIWSDTDLARIKAVSPPELVDTIDLAVTTGLRRGDLIKLSWSHVKDNMIIVDTGKSVRRGKAARQAIIPLYADLRAGLARIPKRSITILTNSLGRPWTDSALCAAFIRAKKAAGIEGKNFHDLRGTAATKFYVAGLQKRVIAEILGWTEDSVENIIHKYVDRTAATKAVISCSTGARHDDISLPTTRSRQVWKDALLRAQQHGEVARP